MACRMDTSGPDAFRHFNAFWKIHPKRRTFCRMEFRWRNPLGAVFRLARFGFVNRLHEAGMLSVPSGTQIIRLLPPLNLSLAEVEEGVKIIEAVAVGLA